tara:strand:- start:302 stop:538 length:237 start_codon:yes stop_codon:yes gene_type:complete
MNLLSKVNKRIPPFVRFVLGLFVLNVFPIIYLTSVGPGIAPAYVAIVFLLINVAALVAYFKLKEFEVDSTIGSVRLKR